MISWIQSLDWAVLDWIQHALSCGFLDTVMPWITRLGNGGFIWILAALLMISRKKYRRNGVMLLCGLLCGVLIGNLSLKNLVARPRPCWLRRNFSCCWRTRRIFPSLPGTPFRPSSPRAAWRGPIAALARQPFRWRR